MPLPMKYFASNIIGNSGLHAKYFSYVDSIPRLLTNLSTASWSTNITLNLTNQSTLSL